PSASTRHVLASPVAVRELSDGSLLVNDTERRQLLAFVPDLSSSRIVADSGGGRESSYGPRAGGIIPYAGDSTLFTDPVGLSMFVLTPSGAIARIASIPRSQDAAVLAMNGSGIDRQGRLIYRASMKMPTLPTTGASSGSTPDSMEINRFDMRSRKLDT